MTDPQNPQQPTNPPATEPPAYAAAPPAAPAYDASGYQPAPGPVPGKTLGIVALVVVFFFSLVGLILGYVARSQSKAAGVPNTPAKVAIILGWVFLVLTIIAGIIIGVLVAQGVSMFTEVCNELGAGVWELTDGSTITCN